MMMLGQQGAYSSSHSIAVLIPSLRSWGFDCRGESHHWGSCVVQTSQNDFALATRHNNEMNSIEWIDSKCFVVIFV